MSGLSIRHARYPDDVPEVLGLLNTAAARLHHQGADQWWYGFGVEPRIVNPVKAGRCLLVIPADDPMAVATVTVCPDGDPDFWTPAELATPAWYVAKWATAQWATKGTGLLLLRWVVDQAHQAGLSVVRADVWRTNEALHELYRQAGWSYLRTEAVIRDNGTPRNSGALFDVAAAEDLTARAAFAGRPDWQQRAMRGSLQPGQRVRVLAAAGMTGRIESVMPADASQPLQGEAPEYPIRHYQAVTDTGGRILVSDEDIEPIP